MSLSIEDFYSAFSKRELKEVELKNFPSSTSGKKGIIYLRGLPHADTQRLRALNKRVLAKRGINVLSGVSDEQDYQDELARVENYLMFKAVCDSTGKQLFKSEKEVEEFNEIVGSECVNEIIFHIEAMNEFYGNFKGRDEALEELKKKSK